MSTARATQCGQPSAPPMDGEAATLAVVAAATALVLVIFTTPLTTLGPTALALGASAGQEAWLLSAMPMGAAAGLLGAGALGDSRGRRIVFLWGLAIMCAGSALAAMAAAPVVIIAVAAPASRSVLKVILIPWFLEFVRGRAPKNERQPLPGAAVFRSGSRIRRRRQAPCSRPRPSRSPLSDRFAGRAFHRDCEP